MAIGIALYNPANRRGRAPTRRSTHVDRVGATLVPRHNSTHNLDRDLSLDSAYRPDSSRSITTPPRLRQRAFGARPVQSQPLGYVRASTVSGRRRIVVMVVGRRTRRVHGRFARPPVRRELCHQRGRAFGFSYPRLRHDNAARSVVDGVMTSVAGEISDRPTTPRRVVPSLAVPVGPTLTAHWSPPNRSVPRSGRCGSATVHRCSIRGDEGTVDGNWVTGMPPPAATRRAITFGLEPGNYALACYIPNADGTSHLELGMHHEFTVH